MNLPWNPEAESALIARLLVDPSQVGSVSSSLSPDDFHGGNNRAVYGAMIRLSEQGKPIDLVTVRDESGLGDDLDIPILSLSAAHQAPIDTYASLIKRDAFRRRYINKLNGLARRASREDDPSVLIAALQDGTAGLAEEVEPNDALGKINLEEHRQEPEPPLLGVLSPHGTTVLYGDGGDGKGWVAARLAAQLSRKVAILDFEMQPSEWAYRLSKFGVTLDDVLYFSPPTTMDRWATEESARMLRTEGVEYLIVDSAMYASDVEDPYSPNGALAYGRARRRLNNLPALLLAHTTGGADKVFGSVFWRNESRIVWRLNKDALTRQRHLSCRKANGYSWLEGTRLNIEFSEEQGILNLHAHGTSWSPEAVA